MMKAVIMAGGQGSRLLEVTNDLIPKALAEIGGMKIIDFQIQMLHRNGINEIYVVIGHLGEKIRDHLGSKVKYIEEKFPLGTAGSLYYLKNIMDDDFLVVFGDVIFDVDIGRMIDFHNRKKSMLTLYAHPNSHPFDSDLVVHDEDYRVSAIIKKKDPRPDFFQNMVNASFFIVSNLALKHVNKIEKMDFEGDFIRRLIDNKENVYAYCFTEYIKDVGTPERLKIAQKALLDGIVYERNLSLPQKAVFLDRDGTINKFVPFLNNPSQVVLHDGAAKAIKTINRSGYLAILITNQPVIARGECSVDGLRLIHDKLEMLLALEGAYLDDIFYCPHHPDKGFDGEVIELKFDCDCRKPKPGMIFEASRKYNIDLTKSWFIGDSDVDLLAATSANVNFQRVDDNNSLLQIVERILSSNEKKNE